jgi:hypothetical protein
MEMTGAAAGIAATATKIDIKLKKNNRISSKGVKPLVFVLDRAMIATVCHLSGRRKA